MGDRVEKELAETKKEIAKLKKQLEKAEKKKAALPQTKDNYVDIYVILLLSLGIVIVIMVAILCTGQVISLPFAVVFAIVATVIVLTISATVFKQLKLTSGEEALGLPKGTIRAIIALALIVIFAIMVIFMQNDLAPQWKEFSPNATLIYPNGTTINYPNGTAVLQEASQAQRDFSLQTLTTISTLVVAIVGFYFGTRAVEVAKGEAPAPSLEITPESPIVLNLSENKVVDPIKAITTPANENADFKIDSSDNGEIIRKQKANEFKYKPSDQLIKEVMDTKQKKEVTLSFWLTNEPKVSALVIIELISGTQPAPPPTPTMPTLKITDPGDSVDVKQGEVTTIALEVTPSDRNIVYEDFDKTKVESVEEDPKKKGTFKVKVKTDAKVNELTKVTFKVEDTEVKAPLTINVKAK